MKRLLLLLGLVICAANTAHAQLRTQGVYRPSAGIREYDRETKVFREHIVVILPPSYLGVARPTEPVPGYYAWKLTFNGASPLTFALRSDSAVTAPNDQVVLRTTRLYLCRDAEQWLLDCTTPVRATARRSREHIELDILDPALASKLRAGKPTILYRQLIEPGGRFRVDEVGVLVP